MKSYKGFNKDMTCRDFQYEEGKEYEETAAEVCETGFHSCEYPLDCFHYYDPAHSVYHEVEADGEIDKADDGTKLASTKLKIGAELSIAGLVKAPIEYTIKRTKKEAGDTETYGASSATGDCGASSATGNYGASSATGYRGASSATGNYGASSADNATAVAIAWGACSKAKGVIGSHLVFADWEYNGDADDDDCEKADAGIDSWTFKGAKMVRVDGETIKENTWYTLRNGEVLEAQ